MAAVCWSQPESFFSEFPIIHPRSTSFFAMSSDLVFINTHNPGDSKSSAQRRAVRSQAAKDHSQASSSRDDVPKRRRHRKMLTVELEVAIDDTESSQSESPPSDTGFGMVKSERSAVVDEVPRRPQEPAIDPSIDYSPVLPMGSMPGGGWAYPFVPHPEASSIPSILSHCMFDIAPCSNARLMVLAKTYGAAD